MFNKLCNLFILECFSRNRINKEKIIVTQSIVDLLIKNRNNTMILNLEK